MRDIIIPILVLVNEYAISILNLTFEFMCYEQEGGGGGEGGEEGGWPGLKYINNK